jgi:hypothetical protein
MKRIRVGNACGFWGDQIDAPARLAASGRLHYLTLEYLAELTLSILAQQKERDPQAGYARDFLEVLESLVPVLQEQPHLKVLTNAGGINPLACARRARALLDQHGLRDRSIAVVLGDDLLPRIDWFIANGHRLTHLDTGKPAADIRTRLVSANVYLGSLPLVLALRQGASVVITGRIADASLTLAPAVHTLDWNWDDLDRLAGATVAGHLIECGAQVTGGLWCNWQEIEDLASVGYPVAEIEESGTFTIDKPANTGGAINIETVSEQLLYEVGDPAAYLTPDVTVDFTSLRLHQVGQDVVRVEGARGKPAPDSYKVSLTYRDGYMASGMLVVHGPDARYKGQRCGEIVFERLRRAGVKPAQTNIECLGAGDSVPGHNRRVADPPEVVLRLTARDPQKAIVERFTRELAPLVTSGPPGITGYATGRPRVREVFAHWPTLVPRDLVVPEVHLVEAPSE